jgi:hypothetical protein
LEVEMSKASLILRGAMVACALCTASLPALAATQAQHGKAPARGYTGDSTQQQRPAILKKEINAAYAEQQSACRKHSSSQRSSCLQQARQTYRNDMANIPQLVASAPTGSVSERVVSVTTAPAAGGTTAYGSSGAGSTGSGSGMQDNSNMSGQQQPQQSMPQSQQPSMDTQAPPASSQNAY